MKKTTIKLTENSLKTLIKEAVKSSLLEMDGGIGFEPEVSDEWCEIREIMGDKEILDAMAGYIGEFELKKFIDYVKRLYLYDYYHSEDEE